MNVGGWNATFQLNRCLIVDGEVDVTRDIKPDGQFVVQRETCLNIRIDKPPGGRMLVCQGRCLLWQLLVLKGGRITRRQTEEQHGRRVRLAIHHSTDEHIAQFHRRIDKGITRSDFPIVDTNNSMLINR